MIVTALAATADHQQPAMAAADRDQPDHSQQHGQGEHAQHAHAVGLDNRGAHRLFRVRTTRRLNTLVGTRPQGQSQTSSQRQQQATAGSNTGQAHTHRGHHRSAG